MIHLKKILLQILPLNVGVAYSSPPAASARLSTQPVSTNLLRVIHLGHLLTNYTLPRTAVVQHLVVTRFYYFVQIRIFSCPPFQHPDNHVITIASSRCSSMVQPWLFIRFFAIDLCTFNAGCRKLLRNVFCL